MKIIKMYILIFYMIVFNGVMVSAAGLNQGVATYRLEAENCYSVINDSGTNQNIIVGGAALAGDNKFVTLYDEGDTVKLTFNVQNAGEYSLILRVRSGWTNSSSGFFSANQYQCHIDGVLENFIGDSSSISAQDTVNGFYWGNLIINELNLDAGEHNVTITMGNYQWGAVDTLYVVQHSATIEAETCYSIVNDVGANRQISLFPAALASNGEYVSLFDNGDSVKLNFTVATDGEYQLAVRVRSGWNASSNSSFFSSPSSSPQYAIKIDDSDATVTGNIASISAQDATNGFCWGNLEAGSINLTAGNHTVEITMGSCEWGAVDALLLTLTKAKPLPFMIEAEAAYTIVNDVGSNQDIVVGNADLASNGKFITLYDDGDAVKFTFNINVAGNYQLAVRERSGWINNSSVFFSNSAYSFMLDNEVMDFVGDSESISALDPHNSFFWGNMIAPVIYLNSGEHSIEVTIRNFNWGAVDLLSGIPVSAPNDGVMILSDTEKKTLERFLFPLPHNYQLAGNVLAFAVPDGGIFINRDPAMSAKSQQFIDDFRSELAVKYSSGTTAMLPVCVKELKIYIGTNDNYVPFQTAINQQQLDLSELHSAPNQEQAYSISVVENSESVDVYIAGNDAAGIYNGLGTFRQLLTAFSSEHRLVVPLVNIVDWPDIKYRGVWGNLDSVAAEQFAAYSQLKLNIYGGPDLRLNYNADHFSYPPTQTIMDCGDRYNIRMIPILAHIDGLLRWWQYIGNNYPNLRGISGSNDTWVEGRYPWCFSQSNSQWVMDQMFTTAASEVNCQQLWVWPSELGYACHCSQCQGNLTEAELKLSQYTHEFDHLIHAFNEAKTINADLQMTLITTQGTRDLNIELLNYLPNEVGLDIYDGSLTYHTEIDRPILAPFDTLINAMNNSGRSLGIVTMFSASHYPANMLFPFNTPILAKTRMTEFKNYGVERMIGWIPPSIFVQQINGESIAEFAWNATGRSRDEFIASWAVRKHLAQPDTVVEIIKLQEYAQLACSKGIRGGDLEPAIERLSAVVMGQTPQHGTYFNILRGFKAPTHSDLVTTLTDCNRAIVLAETQGNEKLIAGAYLTRQWIAIFEQYALYLEDPTANGAGVRNTISGLTAKLSEYWERWIATQSLNADEYNRWHDKMDVLLTYLSNIE